MPEVSDGTFNEPSVPGVIVWIWNVVVPRTRVGEPQSGVGIMIVGMGGVSVAGAANGDPLLRNINPSRMRRTRIPIPSKMETMMIFVLLDKEVS